MNQVIEIGPRFRVASDSSAADEKTILLDAGRAFGDGRHPSTQMCLQAMAVFAPRRPFRLLDVGSGSGILSIGAAKLGGTAFGIDNDASTLAVAHANAIRNAVEPRVEFTTTWPTETFDVVVANILRPILLELAPAIHERLDAKGVLILSGLVSTDVPEIIARYAPLLHGRRPDIFERDAWRCLVWRGR